MKRLLITVAAFTTAQNSDTQQDKWPISVESNRRLLQTCDQHPEPRDLQVYGRIPSWVSGSFIKNGPAIYEFGDDKYHHFFDPLGILNRFEIHGSNQNGESSITHRSQYIESHHFHQNTAANGIVNPEVGTYGEAKWVTQNEDGTPIEDDEQIKKNRLEFVQSHCPTSNSLVSVVPFHGWLLTMNESPIIHLHDPETLVVVHRIDLRESKAFESMKISTMTAHGAYGQGSFWNTAMVVDLSGPFPRTGYVVVESVGAERSGSNPFANKATPQEILDSMRISELVTYSNNPFDLTPPYYHMFGMTENYIILPLTSVVMDVNVLMHELINARPLVTGLRYESDRPFIYKFVNKKTMQLERAEFETAPGSTVHLINAYEDAQGDIVLDTVVAGNGDVMNMFMYDIINGTKEEIERNFLEMAPIGTPTTYHFEMSNNRRTYVHGQPMLHADKNQDWRGFKEGGIEFPIVDFANRYGFEYNHFWAVGFGSIVQDRIYHVDKKNQQKWVYMVEGYSPSEPGFIKNPFSADEDDGIIVSVMSPFHDYDLSPYLVLLDAKTLEYRAHAYLPDNVDIPVSFHGMWVNHDQF